MNYKYTVKKFFFNNFIVKNSLNNYWLNFN